MADPQSKQKKSTEVQPAAAPAEGAPKIPEIKEITKQSAQERSGIALEILQARVLDGSENLTKEIESIDLAETIEQQKDECETLRIVLKGTLNRLFKATLPPAEIKQLTKLPEKVGRQTLAFLPVEQAAFHKLQEILNASGELSTFWKELWSEVVDADYEQYKVAKEAKDAIEAGKFHETTGNGVIDFVKEHTLLAAGIAAAGAYGIYRIIKFFTSSAATPEQAEVSDSGGFFSKAKKWLLGGALLIGGVFTLGQLLGKESLFKFFRDEFKIDIDDSRVVQMLIALSHGDPLEAIRVLFDGPNEYFHMYEDVIGNVKTEQHGRLSHSCLRLMGKKTYKEFIEEETPEEGASKGTKDAAKKAAEEMGISSTMLEFIGIGEAKAEQQKALKDYLKAHADKIIDPNVTVNGALAEITDNPDIYQKEKVAPVDQEPTAGSTAADVAETGVTKDVEFLKEVGSDLKEVLANAPSIMAVFEKYPGPIDIFTHPLAFGKEFLSACAEAGLTVVIGAGAVVLWDGIKFITVTTAETLVGAFSELLQAPFSDQHSVKTAVHEYMVGASPFIVYFSLVKNVPVFFRDGTILEKLGTIAKNTGRGFIYPIEVGREYARLGTAVMREGQWYYYRGRRFMATADMVQAALVDESTYAAEQILKMEAVAKPYNTTDTVIQKWRKDFLSLRSVDEIKAIQETYLKKFFAAQRKLLDAQQRAGIDVTAKRARLDALRDLKSDDAIKLVREFLVQQGINPDTFILAAAEMATRGFKVGDVLELKDGSAFKVTEVAADGTIKGVYRPTAGGAQTDLYRRMEFNDGKVTFTTEAGAPIAGEWEIGRLEAAPVIQTAEYYTDAAGKRKLRVKVNGNPDWIEIEADEKSSKGELLKRLKKELAGKLTADEMAQVEKLFAESKLLKYLPVAEKILGPAGAALMMWHLNTAPDKKKALAETAIGLGSFLAGMKATDWAIGNKVGGGTVDPRRILARAVIDFMGGLAISLGVTEPITEIVDNYIMTFPGAYGTAEQMIDATNKVMAIYGLRTMEKIGLKVAEKTGIQALERIFVRQVENGVMKKIARVVGVDVMKNVIKYIAIKCPIAAALLADDLGPQVIITWIDDIVAVGLLLWTAKDVYDVVMVIRDAMKVTEEMEKRSKAPIESFVVPDQYKAALTEKLKAKGKTIETMMDLGEEQMMAVLHEMPAMELEIIRQGMPGSSEVWIMKNGEVVGMKIKEGNEVIAEVKDGDAEKIDEALAEESQEKQAA